MNVTLALATSILGEEDYVNIAHVLYTERLLQSRLSATSKTKRLNQDVTDYANAVSNGTTANNWEFNCYTAGHKYS